MPMELTKIVSAARDLRASDIHLVRGLPVRLRIDGVLKNFGSPLSAEDCEAYAREMAGEKYSEIAQIGELDLAITFAETIRCRINIFRQQGAVSAAIRILAEKIPELGSLGLPPMVQTLPALNRGIVLVTGETGSGKSTTLAALLDRINHTYDCHIITLEDPIEYIYKPDRCVINQREIGKDTESYASGLRANLHTIETALTAAETGHLVFATLHTNSAPDSIDRIVDVFPEMRQKQIRMQLSTTLMAVLSQQLLPRKTGGRVAACELMMVTPAIRNLIREGKTPQIASSMATSAAEGSITMDNSLIALYRSHIITAETAKNAAHDAEFVKKNVL